ncbi:MAG: DUF2177 family protein [Firmicutes bacterium]|nr:DUF2177 family protein [Bacillota bacterium]
MEFLKTYGVAFLIFFVIDLIWLTLISRKIYNQYLGSFMGDVKWVPAILFYLLFVVGLVFFVISPAIAKQSFATALLSGMLFGLITYATYDLTNLATLKNWPVVITVIDLAWGTALGGIVSSLTYLILK